MGTELSTRTGESPDAMDCVTEIGGTPVVSPSYGGWKLWDLRAPLKVSGVMGL